MGFKGQHNMLVPTGVFERAQKITGKERPYNFLRDILTSAIMEIEVPEPEPEEVKLTGLEINGVKIETEDQLLVAMTQIADILAEARTLSTQ